MILATIVNSFEGIKDLSDLEVIILGNILVEKVDSIGKTYEDALEKARKSAYGFASARLEKISGKNYQTIIIQDAAPKNTDYEPMMILSAVKNNDKWRATTVTTTIYPVSYSRQDKIKNNGNKRFNMLDGPVIVNNPNVQIPQFKKSDYSSQEIMMKAEGIAEAVNKDEAETKARIDACKMLRKEVLSSTYDIIQFLTKNNIARIAEICEKKTVGEDIKVNLDEMYNVFGIKQKKQSY